MRKVTVIIATTLFIGAGFLVGSAHAKSNNPCKAHENQAACSADKACAWDAAKTKCKMVKAQKK